MKKSDIKTLVATKIFGQGSAVGCSSILPLVLNAIVENGADTVEVDDFEEFSTTTAYSSGDIVRNDGKLYKFITNKSAGAWDATKVSQTNVLSILSGMISTLTAEVKTVADLHILVTVTISALSDATLTAEQAAVAGFDAETLAFLMAAHSPIVEFSDMCITFNAVENVSDTVVNQTTMFVREVSGVVTGYKAVLKLNTNGSVSYNVDALA